MVAQTVISEMRRQEAAPYAWIIDVDHTEDAGSEHNEMGTTGPNWASDEHVAKLTANLGFGRMFRMYDADGELYYSGRLIDGRDDRDVEWFGPLDDFGRPNAGCTSIEYFEDGKWVEV